MPLFRPCLTGPIAALALATALPVPFAVAGSELTVSFQEAAPKDVIVIRNATGCPLPGFELRIDLRPSAGRLLFDTTPGGAGIDLAQPFEIVEGGAMVEAFADLTDGDRIARIRFRRMDVGGQVTVNLDLDDTLPEGPLGPTLVTPEEIAGAAVFMAREGLPEISAQFGLDGWAALPLGQCTPMT